MIALTPKTRAEIRNDLAHEIREARRIAALATAHGWDATAEALRRHVATVRRAGKFYHR